MSNSPDSIYLDLSITNNDNLGNKIQNSINFTEARTNSLLDNPSNYDMSIIRFNVDTPGPCLPIITPLINVDGINIDSNELAYTVTMAKVNNLQLDNLTTQHVRFSPEDQSVPVAQNQFKNIIVNNGIKNPTVNKSFSTPGTSYFPTAEFSGNYPIATTPTEYVGNKIENNAHEFNVVWNVGEFTIARIPFNPEPESPPYSYIQIDNIPESNFGYNFTNWTLGRSASLSAYINPSENIFEIYWLSSTSLAIKVYANFPYPLDPGESFTFTRPFGNTTAYEIIFTAPLDIVTAFPNNTVTTIYPIGTNPTVTFSNEADVYVSPIQTSSYPNITEYLGYFVSPSASGFSPPNYNSLNPLQLTTNAPPIPTTTNFYAGAILSVAYANFLLYQSTRYTLLTSSTILVNDIAFTPADAVLNYSYVLGGLLEAIPNICSETVVSGINFQSAFNEVMVFMGDILTELATVNSYTPALNPQQEIDAVGAIVTFESAIYNIGIPPSNGVPPNMPLTLMSFFSNGGGNSCYINTASYFKISSLPINYENYVNNGTLLGFDYNNGVDFTTFITPPITVIGLDGFNNLVYEFDPFTWPPLIDNALSQIRNLRLYIHDAALINSSYGLTTISSVSSGSLTLAAAQDPTPYFPFLYQNLIYVPNIEHFINSFWQTTAQVVSPSRMVISLLQPSGFPLNIPSASIPAVGIVTTNITAYEPITITASSYSSVTDSTTFSPANWALPNIPATIAPNNLNVQYLIVTTMAFPPIFNQWTSNLLSISMEGVSTTNVISSQNISNGYYNIYNVKWFLCLVNKCLRDVWLAIEPTQAALVPYFTVDENTNFFTLFTPCITTPTVINFAPSETAANGLSVTSPVYVGENSNPAVTHTIFFNEPLYNLFCGINSVYYGNKVPIFVNPVDQTLANANPYLFNYYMQPINYSNLNKTGNYIFSTSEYSSVPMWSPIKSIQFTSTLLPNLLTYTSTPVPFNNLNHNGQQNVGNNSEISAQITDIQVGLLTGSEYKPQLLYIPKAQYRLISLLGSNAINNVDFQISFTNKYGQTIPMRLSSQCTANLKILFQRKRMNLKNLPPYDTN